MIANDFTNAMLKLVPRRNHTTDTAYRRAYVARRDRAKRNSYTLHDENVGQTLADQTINGSSIVRMVGQRSLEVILAATTSSPNDYYVSEPHPRVDIMASDLMIKALSLHPGWGSTNVLDYYLCLPQLDAQLAVAPLVTHTVKVGSGLEDGHLVQKIFIRDPARAQYDGTWPQLLNEVDTGMDFLGDGYDARNQNAWIDLKLTGDRSSLTSIEVGRISLAELSEDEATYCLPDISSLIERKVTLEAMSIYPPE
jgi:hypothetical protein